MSRYKTVTDNRRWSENLNLEAFSVANWRISYIVGDKPYFLSEWRKTENAFSVYIDVLLWSTQKHNGQYLMVLPGYNM